MSCPLPLSDYPQIVLAHGGGGKLMHELIEKVFLASFDNRLLANRHDAATLPIGGEKIAFTTDSYVVSPLFFPGGDIGSLSIHGTVNDLAMAGARPRYISASFILEEGLSTETLWRVTQSMKMALLACNVEIVTGDTKVVDKGKGDGVFITTTGVGSIEHSDDIGPGSISVGDSIILSGDIGRHGIAVLCARETLEFEHLLPSDSAPVWPAVSALFDSGVEIHCMRDLTRGGLASALVELGSAAKMEIVIEEQEIVVDEAVEGPCELLGLDPLYVANEGRFVLFVPPGESTKALAVLKNHNPSASIIGRVSKATQGPVIMRRSIGTERVIDMISGEQLPRIC